MDANQIRSKLNEFRQENGLKGGPGFGKKLQKQYLDNSGKEIAEFSDGTRMYIDSPEYQDLYSKGIVYGENREGQIYLQNSEKNPEMVRYQELMNEDSFEDSMKQLMQGTTGALGKGLGYSQDKFWESDPEYKQNYDRRMDSKYVEDFFQRNPKNENEERGEYLDRVTKSLPPEIGKFITQNLNPGNQTSYWQDAGRGLTRIVSDQLGGNDEDFMDILDQDSGLSGLEKSEKRQQYQENPGGMEDRFSTLAPLAIPGKIVQSLYRPEYYLKDALSGQKNNAGILEDIGTDMVATGALTSALKGFQMTAPLRKGLADAGKIIQEEGIPQLNSAVKGYKNGLKRSFTEPRAIDRFVPAESSLTRPEVKELREIQSLSSLAEDSNVDQVTLYNKYLKSSLNDDNLVRVTGKNRSQIQERLDDMIAGKKEVFDLGEEPLSMSEFLERPPREIRIPQTPRPTRNSTVDPNVSDVELNALRARAREIERKQVENNGRGFADGSRLRNIFSPRKDISGFVDIKPEDGQEVTSLLPSLFKRGDVNSEDVTSKMMGAFSEIKNADKGYYNASGSISDSSAPLYYTNASRLSSEKNIDFMMDGFTTLNNYGYLNKAGVEKGKILEFMNNHISKLDFKGKKLPQAYLDEVGEVQIPNLVLKKSGLAGLFTAGTGYEKYLEKKQAGGQIREDGTTKGRGFFGEVSNSDGSYSTEISRGFEWDGKEHLIPSLAPGITSFQLKYLQDNGGNYGGDDNMNDAIDKNALRYAQLRQLQNQPFFATPEEEGKLSVYQQGGQIETDWKQKYSSNQYFKDREDWGDKLSNKFPNAKNTVKESIYSAAKQAQIDPGLLYTSAMEEGMKLALNGRDTGERRQGFAEYRKNDPKGAKEYPIDGGYYYGLNTFGDKYGQTISRGNLPPGFKFAPYEQKDAQGKKLYTSGAFRSHEDAISAKAAQMKQVEGSMTSRLKQNNINLTPEARKFFDMVGYNMGEEKTIQMIQSYQNKGYLKDDKFLGSDFEPGSWKEPYINVQRRYQNYKILNEQGYFSDYQTTPPIAGTQNKGPQIQKNGGPIRYNLDIMNQIIENNRK